jgi:hypothetical protein
MRDKMSRKRTKKASGWMQTVFYSIAGVPLFERLGDAPPPSYSYNMTANTADSGLLLSSLVFSQGLVHRPPHAVYSIRTLLCQCSMAQSTPPFGQPPLQRVPSFPCLHPTQEAVSPLPHSVAWVERVSRAVAHLYPSERRMCAYLGQKIEGLNS